MRGKIFTAPNLMSFLRLLMIPAIVRLYVQENHNAALGMLIISGITDIADGFVARRFNMVSDLGKILDPAADKLTQAALLLCLAYRAALLRPLVMILMLKETVLAVFGAVLFYEAGIVKSSCWHGKLAAALLYLTIGIHIAVPQMNTGLSHMLAVGTGAAMLLSFVLYMRRNLILLRGGKSPEAENKRLT